MDLVELDFPSPPLESAALTVDLGQEGHAYQEDNLMVR